MSEPEATGHSCCGHCLPADTGITVSGEGAVIPDVPELLAALREAIERHDGHRIATTFEQIRERHAQLSAQDKARMAAEVGQVWATLNAEIETMPEVQRDRLVVQVQEVEHSRHRKSPDAGCVLCTTGPDGRRIFIRGERLGDELEREDGTPEPDPAVPVRSIVIVWTRHDDGLWRAVNNPNPEGYAYPWPLLLRTFPRLVEVLPGDDKYPEP